MLDLDADGEGSPWGHLEKALCSSSCRCRITGRRSAAGVRAPGKGTRCRGLLEAQPVLAEVAARFVGVPLEAEGQWVRSNTIRVHPPNAQVQLQANQWKRVAKPRAIRRSLVSCNVR